MTGIIHTADEFLGGRLRIKQPRAGFRAGLDSVLLAAAVRARAGENVLDAGAGAGVASLCLAARQPGLAIHAVDSNPDAVHLCTENIAANNLAEYVKACEGDVFDLPSLVGRDRFEHVLTNPPFHDGSRERASPDAGKAAAHGFDGAYGEAIEKWIAACLAVLKTKGMLWMINRTEAMTPTLAALEGRAGDITIVPLWPHAGEPAKRVIITARKGAKGAGRLHPGIVLHEADGKFTPEIEAALRAGEPLSLDAP